MGIAVDLGSPTKLAEQGNEISQKSEELKKEIDNIYHIVDELKEAWKGQSASRYVDNIEKFRPDLEEFAKALDAHGKVINSIGEQYKDLENNL